MGKPSVQRQHLLMLLPFYVLFQYAVLFTHALCICCWICLYFWLYLLSLFLYSLCRFSPFSSLTQPTYSRIVPCCKMNKIDWQLNGEQLCFTKENVCLLNYKSSCFFCFFSLQCVMASGQESWLTRCPSMPPTLNPSGIAQKSMATLLSSTPRFMGKLRKSGDNLTVEYLFTACLRIFISGR